jgi:hypothetical protein
MNTTANMDDPAYWLRRADEARSAAEDVADPISKKTLLDIADAYVQLASFAAGKLDGKKRGEQEQNQT